MALEQTQAGFMQTADQRRVWVIFSGLMLALLIASLDQTVVETALPTIVSDFGGLSQLSWIVTGYLLTSTVSTPLRTYPKTGGSVVEWRRTEQKFKGEEEEEESDDQNETVESQ